MGGIFITIIGVMELFHIYFLLMMPKNSLLSAKDVLKKTFCRSWLSPSTGWLCKMISSYTRFFLPICDANNSGIVYGPRQEYFSYDETFSSRYVFDIAPLRLLRQ